LIVAEERITHVSKKMLRAALVVIAAVVFIVIAVVKVFR